MLEEALPGTSNLKSNTAGWNYLTADISQYCQGGKDGTHRSKVGCARQVVTETL